MPISLPPDVTTTSPAATQAAPASLPTSSADLQTLAKVLPGLSPDDLTKLRNAMDRGGISLDSLTNRGSKYILSIVPWRLESPVFFHGGGRKVYELPATEKGQYHVLRIDNTFTKIMDLTQDADEISQRGHDYTARPIAAQHVVDDLIQHFAGDHPANASGGRIGVMQIAGPIPTKQELDSARDNQLKFFRNLVAQADAYYIDPQRRHRIQAEHHRALIYLDAEDPKRHPWFVDIGPENSINCPACHSATPSQAYICPQCRTDMADYYLRRGIEVNAAVMPGVAAEVQFRKKELMAQVQAQSETKKAPTAPATTTKGG
jgi:hypothetical protein